MTLFWKIFSAVFISFVIVVSAVSYLVTSSKISDTEKNLISRYNIVGTFFAKNIEHYYRESRWPFEALKEISGSQGFLFWWVVTDTGNIFLADKTPFMGTPATHYFPQIQSAVIKKEVIVNPKSNYGILIYPLNLGKERWSFWLGFSLTEVKIIEKKIVFLGLSVSMAALLLLGGILYFTVKHFTGHIQDLSMSAARIGGGDFDHRITIKSRDELGQLGVSFNRMAENLKKTTVSKDYVDNIIETMLDALIVTDHEGKIITVNKAACTLADYEKAQLIGLSFRAILGNDLPFGTQKGCLIESGETKNLELLCRTREGKEIPVLFSWSAMEDAAGNIIGFVGTAKDITDLKETEEALRVSEEKYRLVFEKAPLGIMHYDQTSTITDCNEKFAEIIGASKEQFIGFSLMQRLNDDKMREALAASLKGEAGYYEGDYLSVTAGKLTPVRAIFQPIFLSDSVLSGGVTIFEDISERKQAELERLQFSKLESLGTLAGGIAHDFNNFIAAIMGNIEMALMDNKLGERTQKRLEQAEKGCHRARDLTKKLLTFAKGGAPIKKPMFIRQLINESAQFALTGSNVTCEIDIPKDLWPIEVDETQITQVIHNIVINAQQAMPDGGIIQISAENTILEDDSEFLLNSGKYVRVAFADQGEGIPPENLSRIFDPYFSTRAKGIGLGLAAAYSIIKGHGGYLTVDSKMGAGSTFIFYLPASDKTVQPQEEPAVELVPGQGRVLVMDDEQMIIDFLQQILSQIGYEVECARDGHEAIALYEEAKRSGRTFAAVIMDLTIPGGMGGKEAINFLLELDPHCKAIVSSGYSDDPIMADFQKFGFSGFIAKPYKVSELSKILHEVIIKNI